MKNEILFWQTRIKLTQAPVQTQIENSSEEKETLNKIIPEIRSFLFDPDSETCKKSYGFEISAYDRIDVSFFTRADSEIEAIELGNNWLSNLKYKFKGLDGIIEIYPVSNNGRELENGFETLEFKFPNGVLANKVNIIERFISAFFNFKQYKFKLIILWQQKPEKKEIGRIQKPAFYIRLFILYQKIMKDTKILYRFMGIVKFLSMDIQNIHLKRAILNNASEISYLDIIGGNLFNKEQEISYFKEDFNFDFPERLPLPRLPILEYENVRYIDVDEEFKKYSLTLGKHIKDGIITSHCTYLPFNKLPQDMTIFGQSGSGKTYFLAEIISELCSKAPKVGILILNVAKESQDIFYHDFTIIKYSDEKFQIPYFFEGHSLEKILQETATYICASLGLKNVFEKIIFQVQRDYLKLKGTLPKFLFELLKSVESYVENNPYGSDTQANLIQALRNRMNIFDEKHLQLVLKKAEILPDWFETWLNGGKIFLDLSMCNKFTKLLIVNSIFQLVRTLTKDSELQELKHLIVIDEAHAILENPITKNSDDTDFIMKEQMEKIFSELLKEYRSRGVGLVIADQSPSRLFNDVVSQPSIKIIFRQDYPNNLLFSEDPKERQMLTQLENRLALVINGATGEKYLIKTIEYNLKQ